MKAQGESLKVAVYLLGVWLILVIIIITTTTWLLGDNDFYSPGGDRECSVVTSPSVH